MRVVRTPEEGGDAAEVPNALCEDCIGVLNRLREMKLSHDRMLASSR